MSEELRYTLSADIQTFRLAQDMMDREQYRSVKNREISRP